MVDDLACNGISVLTRFISTGSNNELTILDVDAILGTLQVNRHLLNRFRAGRHGNSL